GPALLDGARRDHPHREQPQVRPSQAVHAAAGGGLDSRRTLGRFGGAFLDRAGRRDQGPEHPMRTWPELDYSVDKGTIETPHLLLQLIGKLPVRLHPWVNHSWHVTLRMTPRGAVTRTLPAGDRFFTAELDFLDGAIRI